ncbi:hypothetical protein [Geodermatophilus sp. URMC 62]
MGARQAVRDHIEPNGKHELLDRVLDRALLASIAGLLRDGTAPWS